MKSKVPTCLSPFPVTEDNADAEQKKQEKSEDGAHYCQWDCAVIITVLNHLCN